MFRVFITKSSKETQGLGRMLAGKFKNGLIIALSGDLRAGKTTFTQGFLKGLNVKGPYTSPTFLIIKQYHVSHSAKHKTKNKNEIYHIDAYRIGSEDIISLGWKEIIANPKNIVIIEWADRIKRIIPKSALWIKFEWTDENKRKITIGDDKNNEHKIK